MAFNLVSRIIDSSGNPLTTINPLPVDGGHSTEDSSGQLPTLSKNTEVTYRTILGGGSTVFTWDMSQFNSFYIQVNNKGRSPSCTFVVSTTNGNLSDSSSWNPIPLEVIAAALIGVISSATLSVRQPNYGAAIYSGGKTGKYMKIELSADTTTLNEVIIHCSSSRYVPRKNDLLSNRMASWNYVSNSVLTTTTPVQLVTGDSPAYSRALAFLQLTNSGTAGSEYLIQSDANSAVLYRGYIGAGATQTIKPELPLVATSASSITFTLVTATNVSVYILAQGFTTI